MDRREFLIASAAGIITPKLALIQSDPHENPIYSGWLPTEQTIRARSLSQQASKHFIGSGRGKIVLLHKYLTRALGRVVPHNQIGPDCIGQAFGLGVDTLAATQIYGLGLKETFEGKASTEAIYAGSRYEIGYKLHDDFRVLNTGGSYGVYAAEYLQNYGVLVRKRYGDIDLTNYDPKLAQKWGRNGIPDKLESIAKQHPVKHYALVQSYADCRDAIANGYPVILCSNVGFNPNCRKHNPSKGRDAEGFLNKCGKWYHAMLALAVDDTKRPGILSISSWGSDWVTGPKRLFQPEGSFWIDSETIDKMCEQSDSFAISDFIGFRKNDNLDYRLF